MKLKCIIDIVQDEKLEAEYKTIKKSLEERGLMNKNKTFEAYTIDNGYAQKTYKGKLNPGIELTELELSMVCDGGYSYFGGSSVINKDRTFTAVIYID